MNVNKTSTLVMPANVLNIIGEQRNIQFVIWKFVAEKHVISPTYKGNININAFKHRFQLLQKTP